MYEHVVFDLDGTLADTRDDLVAAVNHALQTLRLPALPAQVVCSYVGEGAQRLLGRALGADHQDRIDDAMPVFLNYYDEHLLDRTTAYPGIEQVVSTLHRSGVTLSLLSNKPERFSRRILDGLGLSPAFAFIVGGDSLATRKPDPCGIDHLLGLSGTPRNRMLLVGDSAIDMETARAARVAFCGVIWGIRPGELVHAPGAPVLVQRAEDLIGVVQHGC
jgi:phosphoglycolate phosphatase